MQMMLIGTLGDRDPLSGVGNVELKLSADEKEITGVMIADQCVLKKAWRNTICPFEQYHRPFSEMKKNRTSTCNTKNILLCSFEGRISLATKVLYTTYHGILFLSRCVMENWSTLQSIFCCTAWSLFCKNSIRNRYESRTCVNIH